MQGTFCRRLTVMTQGLCISPSSLSLSIVLFVNPPDLFLALLSVVILIVLALRGRTRGGGDAPFLVLNNVLLFFTHCCTACGFLRLLLKNSYVLFRGMYMFRFL